MVRNETRNKPFDSMKCLEKLNIPFKRGVYILEKWVDKGMISYGVSLNYPWIEDKEKGDEEMLK